MSEIDLNGLKMKMRAYEKVSKSILDQYAKKEELEKYVLDIPVGDLSGPKVRVHGEWIDGVEDVPADYPTDKQYARKHREWVEVESAYKRPSILLCEFVGLEPEYEEDTEITIQAIRHQEENIVHIWEGKMHLYMKQGTGDYVLIDSVDASATEVTDEIGYKFTITDDVVLKFEMETDIGNFYKVEFPITMIRTTAFYTGHNQLTTVTASDVLNLEKKDFDPDGEYEYDLDAEDYIWWCSSFEINDIKQYGLYSIDLVKQENKVTVDGMELFCYRTKERLTTGNWWFTIDADPHPQPEPEPEKRDLRIGGSLLEELDEDELNALTPYDYEDGKIFTVNLHQEAYVWICTPYNIRIMDASGMEPDFVNGGIIQLDGKAFICHRSLYILTDGRWQFKFKKK